MHSTQSSPFSKERAFNHRLQRRESELNSYPGTSILDRQPEEQRCPCQRDSQSGNKAKKQPWAKQALATREQMPRSQRQKPDLQE